MANWGQAKGDQASKQITSWLNDVGRFFKDLVSSDKSAAGKAGAAQPSGASNELQLGEDEIARAAYAAAVQRRIGDCGKRVEKAAEQWKTKYGISVAPDLQFSKELLKKISIRQKLELSKGDIKHTVGLDITVQDPFKSSETSLKAKASWSVANQRTGLSAGASVETVVLGVLTDNARFVKTVALSSFVTYNSKNLKTGLFISATIPFEKNPRTGIVEQKPAILSLQHQLSWTINSQTSFNSNLQVVATPSGLLKGSLDFSVKNGLSTFGVNLSRDSTTGPQIDFAKVYFNRDIKMGDVKGTAGIWAGYKGIDTPGAGFKSGAAIGVQFSLQW